jgi:nucleoside-diphosphate-sugar epimerase
MNVLITGGAGYIGSVLVGMLLDNGYNVTVIDNYRYNQVSLLRHCGNERFNVVRGDCRDMNVVKRHLKSSDVIIPLAAIVGASACDNDTVAATTTNHGAIRDICSIKSDNQMLIYPNTNSGYGIGQDGVFCTEDTPMNPISHYGKTKMKAEYCVLSECKGVVLRLATVFGTSERMRMDLLVNDFVYRALTDRFVVLYEPEFKRNYIHIKDVARAFMFCIENYDIMKGEAFNLGLSWANLSKDELCQQIKAWIPEFHYFTSEYNTDIDQRNYIVSNAKIEGLGFKPKWDINDGIQELIKAYQIVNNHKYTNL